MDTELTAVGRFTSGFLGMLAHLRRVCRVCRVFFFFFGHVGPIYVGFVGFSSRVFGHEGPIYVGFVGLFFVGFLGMRGPFTSVFSRGFFVRVARREEVAGKEEVAVRFFCFLVIAFLLCGLGMPSATCT